MCYFVFLGVPQKYSTALGHFGAGQLSIGAVKNVSLKTVFPENFSYAAVTHGGCGCDLYAEKPVGDVEEKARARFVKKGWSKTKVERALESKKRAGFTRERPIYRAFRQLVVALAIETGSVCLYSHFFTGDVAGEVLENGGTLRYSLAEYEDKEGTFPQDSLLIVSGVNG